MTEAKLIRALQSRSFGIIIMTIVTIMAIVSFYFYPVQSVQSNEGLVFNEGGPWITVPIASLIINIIGFLVVALFFVIINHRFQIVKSSTWFFTGLFFLMLLSYPKVMLNFTGGTLLVMVIALCTVLLFSMFDNQKNTRKTFLIFFLLVTGSLWEINLLYFIIVFLIGLVQVKVFNFRNLLAAITGMITPLWIVFGLGLASPEDIRIPSYNMTDIYNFLEKEQSTVIIYLSTLLIGLIFLAGNMISAINYNAARRAYNAFLSLMFIVVGLLAFVNPENLPVYVPLTYILVAFGIAHYYASRNHGNPYLMIILLAAYAGVVVWNFL